jgi:hypothetical protein
LFPHDSATNASRATSNASATVEERRFSAASGDKKKKNSILPKAVAAERSSQATQTFRAFAKAGPRREDRKGPPPIPRFPQPQGIL